MSSRAAVSPHLPLDDVVALATSDACRVSVAGAPDATSTSAVVSTLVPLSTCLPSLNDLKPHIERRCAAGMSDAAATAERFLGEVGLENRLNHYPTTLSGGEQQRVAIARAFARQPRILFADEPTGNLDTRTGERVIELLFELNDRIETSLVLVTHDQRLAERCQRCFNMSAGELREA